MLRFCQTVLNFYKKHGRHELPWRKTTNPYKILVSEMMLQQTQVERVVPYYQRFIKAYPTAVKLAAAPLSSVLKMWQGLGYNRRAKMLHQAAKVLVAEHHSTFPAVYSEFVELPGVGPYTARAIMAFAYNADVVFIETNIRTAIIHHFFRGRRSVRDTELAEVLQELLPRGRAREWYSALMDYGAYLKKSGLKLNAKSKHYTKQSKFSGSPREARGAVLRELAKGSRTSAQLQLALGKEHAARVRAALSALLTEGLIEKRGNRFRLPR